MDTLITTDYVANVWPDPAYHFAATASAESELTLVYFEDREGKRTEAARISFGSLDEMEAVAKAMLRVVELARNK